MSGIRELAETLDEIVRERGAHLRLATPLRELATYARAAMDAIDPQSENPLVQHLDELLGAVEEQRNQLREVVAMAGHETQAAVAAKLVSAGPDIDADELALNHCVGLDVMVIAMNDEVFDAALLDGLDLTGKAVLLHSGWDRYWGTDRYGNPADPHVDEAGARALVAAGVTLVGIDSVNIDDTRSGARPAHTVLLGAEVLIVEHLTNLGALPRTGARFTAVPPAIRGLATFPVRAFAVVDDL